MFIRALMVLGIKDKAGNGPIFPGTIADVNEADGKRLVSLGHAAEVPGSGAQTAGEPTLIVFPDVNTMKAESAERAQKTGETVTGHLDGNDLEGMSFADLKALAKDMGIDTGKIRSKSGMIEAITSVEVEAPLNDDDDLPDLAPQEVVDE